VDVDVDVVDVDVDVDVDADAEVDVVEVDSPCSAINVVVVSGVVEEATSEGEFSKALVISTTNSLEEEMSGILELAYGGTTLLKVGGAVVESPDVEGDTVGKVDSASGVVDALVDALVDEPNVEEGHTNGEEDSMNDVVDTANVEEGDTVGEEESVNGVVGSLENEEELATAVKSSVVVVRARACATRNKIGSESIFVDVLITIQTLW
jgi:hypothetical protein